MTGSGSMTCTGRSPRPAARGPRSAHRLDLRQCVDFFSAWPEAQSVDYAANA